MPGLVFLLVASSVLAADAQDSAPARHDCYSIAPEERSDGSVVKPPAVCMAMMKNLNEFCSTAPRICGIPISPGIPQLSTPKWRLLDAKEDFSLVENLVRGHWLPLKELDPAAYSRVVSEVISRFKVARDAMQLRVEQSTFDFGNGLGVAPTYRVSTGSCAAELADPAMIHTKKRDDGSTTLYVGKAAEIGDGTSSLVEIPAPSRKTFPGRSLSGQIWTPFFYNSQTHYVDLSLAPDELLVLRPYSLIPEGVAKTFCVIRFNPPSR